MSSSALVALLSGSGVFGLGLVLPFLAAEYERRRGVRTKAPAVRDPLPAGDSSRASRPSIGVIIPAYLESSVIGDTITSLRAQLERWPAEATITVVASDEPTARAAEAHGAVVLRTDPAGKPAAINAGVEASLSDVIVLTDANCRISPAEWPDLLVEELSRSDLVSAVKTESGKREEAYWKYEAAVKNYRSLSQETLSVIGEFVAFRRESFVPLPVHVLVDDLELATGFALRGMSVRICSGIVTSEPAAIGGEQLERRIRISAGHWAQALPRWRELLAVPAGRQFLAHKGYRMSIGALGFWVAVAGFALLAPPWTALVAAVWVLGAWYVYGYTTNAPALLRLGASITVLQAVTFAGLGRAVKRSLSRRPQQGWKKAAR